MHTCLLNELGRNIFFDFKYVFKDFDFDFNFFLSKDLKKKKKKQIQDFDNYYVFWKLKNKYNIWLQINTIPKNIYKLIIISPLHCVINFYEFVISWVIIFMSMHLKLKPLGQKMKLLIKNTSHKVLYKGESEREKYYN